MKTPIEQLLKHIDDAIDNNGMVGSIIYPTVESALLNIRDKVEMINNLEKLRTSPERRYMIDFVKWITENYEFKELVNTYEVVDKWEESKT